MLRNCIENYFKAFGTVIKLIYQYPIKSLVHVYFRLKKKFRVRLLVRAKKSLNVQNSLAKIISKFKFSSGIKLTVDVDPINFN